MNQTQDKKQRGGDIYIQPPKLAIVNLLDFDMKQQQSNNMVKVVNHLTNESKEEKTGKRD